MRSVLNKAAGILFLSVVAVACLTPAQASPFAGVNEAFWSASFAHYISADGTATLIIPAGITVTCFGGATTTGLNGCRDSASLIVTDGSSSISKTSGLIITNTNDSELTGELTFDTGYSAFNPGGSTIGAQVDDPTTEYAAFSSSVFGPGAADSHGCNTLTGPHFMGPDACGVSSPDSSDEMFAVGPLAAGQSATETYNINIFAEVIVPEPSTLALFMVGLASAGALARRKRARVGI